MSFLQRLPEWLREDPLANSINDETESVKIKSYYNLLRQYIKQPVQVWARYKKEDVSLTRSNLAEDSVIEVDITGCYPVMPKITLKDTTCCTPPNAVEGPIIIKGGNKTLTINKDLPSGGEMVIYPDGRIKINGIGIDSVVGFSYTEKDILIPFGKITNERKLMQKFTPSTYTKELKILFNRMMGSPDDNIHLELWSLDNGIQKEKLASLEVRNELLSPDFYIRFPIDLELEDEEHAIIIKREHDHSDESFFVLSGGEYQDGNLSYWNGVTWVETNYNIFLEESIPFVSGEYPEIHPETGTITFEYANIVNSSEDDAEFEAEEGGVVSKLEFEAISLKSIHYRAMAYALYPLERVRLYIGDTLIEEEEFIKEHHQFCYQMNIDAEDLPQDLISEMPFEFWTETAWHYFDKTILKGFPQDYDHENSMFHPNYALDKLTKNLGMFRRNYRQNIKYYEYGSTYPLGYPFKVEQDYCLEKRMLNEYVTTKYSNNKVFLTRDDDHIIKLKSKKLYSYPIQIITIERGENKIIEISYTNELKETYKELYTFDTAIKTTARINNQSDIVSAILIEESDDIDVDEVYYLYPDGIYRRYGLIHSEIYGYLGVIPTIKDMVDYCSIHNVNYWDYEYWGGDIFDAPVFRVDIPYPIPSNFNVLSNIEVNKLLGKCKSLGTHGLSAYSNIVNQEMQLSTNSDPPELFVEIDQEIGIQLRPGDFSDMLFQPTIRAEWELLEWEVSSETTLNLLMDVYGAQVFDQFSEIVLSDFQENYMSNTMAGNIGSSGYVKIGGASNESATSQASTAVYENRNPTGWMSWSNTMAGRVAGDGVATTNGSSYISQPEYTGYPYTDGLTFSGYSGLNAIPNDAIITGIKVRWSTNSTGNTNAYCELRTGKGNSEKQKPITSGWKEQEFGGDGDTWGITGLRGADVKDMRLMFYFGIMPNGTKVEYDWNYVTVYYRTRIGTFMTPSIIPPDSNPDSQWGRLTDVRLDTPFPGCEAYYDIIKENYSFGNTSNPTDFIFGENGQRKLLQIFKPTDTKLCGIGVFPRGTYGLPGDRVKISITTLDAAMNPATILGSSSIAVGKWGTSGEIIFPLDLTLSTSQSYGILIERTGSLSTSNYYKLSATNNNVYINGRLRFLQNTSIWTDHNNGNADLCFKVYTPSVVFSDIKTPFNLKDVPYAQIKLRGKLYTENLNYTPMIGEIKLDREVVNNG